MEYLIDEAEDYIMFGYGFKTFFLDYKEVYSPKDINTAWDKAVILLKNKLSEGE